jgi:hypothetical protein
MGLLGRFEFQGNLNDTAGEVSLVLQKWNTIYGADRKGVRNSAITFNENMG